MLYVALGKCDASVRCVRYLGHPLAHRWYTSHLTEWKHSPAEEMGIAVSCDHLQGEKGEGISILQRQDTLFLICDKKVRV